VEEGWRWTGLRSLASAMRGNEDWGVYWVVKQFIKSGSRKARAPTVCTAGHRQWQQILLVACNAFY